MRATHRRSRRAIVLVALTTLLAIGATTAMTATPRRRPRRLLRPGAKRRRSTTTTSPALNLNEPGTPLGPAKPTTLRDERNTAAATVQSDILSPPSHGGPPS